MASKTFTYAGVNHNWTTAGNWNLGTLPIDNDSVTIPINETCTFDADMSNAGTWPNGIAGITVTGTLNCTNTPGSYYLKIKAATTLAGAGTVNWGSTVFTAKHTLTGGTAWYVQGSGGLTFSCVGTEPSIKTVRLTGAEIIGATRLEIDTNITGDIWAIGDTIRINNVNKGYDSESRVIQDIQSTYIDISVGLTAAKIIGTTICLMTRNTKIIGVGTATVTLYNFSSVAGVGKLSISGGEFNTTYIIFQSNPCMSISGGTFTATNYMINSAAYITISGGVFCGIGTGIVNSSIGAIISGGEFHGSNLGIYNCAGTLVIGGIFSGMSNIGVNSEIKILGGTFLGSTKGFYQCTLFLTGATFTNNTNDIMRCISGKMYNQVLTSSPDVWSEYPTSQTNYLESINHGNSPGAFRAWTKGGNTTDVASPVPSGFVRAYQITLAYESFIGFWQKQVLVPAGKAVQFTFYIRKDVSMAYKPRVWVFLESMEPFISGTPLKEFIYPDDTNDTWATDTFTYTNTNNYDKMLIVRFLGKNDSGNVYTQLAVNPISGQGAMRSAFG
jgi:hypothetical protein